MTAVARWDVGVWDRDVWGPVGVVWADTWDWWVQTGQTRVQTLSGYIVEARWTSDGYTPGDGTFRGDVQPGRLALRIVDPHGTLAAIDKLAQIWGCYRPTGATWCFYIDEISQPLVAPGDPAGGYRVITASSWPARLTTGSYAATRPAESVLSRLNYLVGRWSSDTGLYLPSVSSSLAVDNHQMTANTDQYRPWIQIARDAAPNGMFWIEAVRDPIGVGRIVVHYDLWDTAPQRTVPNNQIVAGTVTTQGVSDLVTLVHWAGTSAAGVATPLDQYGGGFGAYGLISYGPMRVWGDITVAGADYSAVSTTGTRILTDRGDPNALYLSAVSFISGTRRTGAGALVAWDPTVMVWTDPTFVMKTTVQGVDYRWRVTQTAFVLDAKSWTATASLVKYTQPVALTAVAADSEMAA